MDEQAASFGVARGSREPEGRDLMREVALVGDAQDAVGGQLRGQVEALVAHTDGGVRLRQPRAVRLLGDGEAGLATVLGGDVDDHVLAGSHGDRRGVVLVRGHVGAGDEPAELRQAVE